MLPHWYVAKKYTKFLRKMKFLLDENLHLSLLETFKELNLECKHAKNVGLTGAKDEEITNYARNNEFILLTKDLEFGNLILYPRGSHYGLIVINLPHNFKTEQIKNQIKNFLKKIDLEVLVGSIVILQLGRYRIR